MAGAKVGCRAGQRERIVGVGVGVKLTLSISTWETHTLRIPKMIMG